MTLEGDSYKLARPLRLRVDRESKRLARSGLRRGGLPEGRLAMRGAHLVDPRRLVGIVNAAGPLSARATTSNHVRRIVQAASLDGTARPGSDHADAAYETDNLQAGVLIGQCAKATMGSKPNAALVNCKAG